MFQKSDNFFLMNKNSKRVLEIRNNTDTAKMERENQLIQACMAYNKFGTRSWSSLKEISIAHQHTAL